MRDDEYRRRIVHHMVLGELVLRPIPGDVAERVGVFAAALGVDDDFVEVARRYAQGAFGLAWVDLRRSGFAEHWDDDKLGSLHTAAQFDDPFDATGPDPELEARWAAFGELPEGTLGRSVYEMYIGRGFALPGNPNGASAFIAQHDFVHVLADYGTNLEGELETFALVGRADPDPKGFAWLATMVGLFETGYVHEQGFFKVDVRERHLQVAGMGVRLADALRRGQGRGRAVRHRPLLRRLPRGGRPSARRGARDAAPAAEVARGDRRRVARHLRPRGDVGGPARVRRPRRIGG